MTKPFEIFTEKNFEKISDGNATWHIDYKWQRELIAHVVNRILNEKGTRVYLTVDGGRYEAQVKMLEGIDTHEALLLPPRRIEK